MYRFGVELELELEKVFVWAKGRGWKVMELENGGK